MRSNEKLSPRLLNFSVQVLKFLGEVRTYRETDVIKYQLSRSATSIGANYEESQSSSKPEFKLRIRICIREALETKYWLTICKELKIGDEVLVSKLIDENIQLVKILRAIYKKTSN
ncbi:MAG: four helix bundle protein [Melioribacteraceae bacterium]|nr:four helix bundle protein [Melioribacteraceae bacterium]MDD3559085.1 four helix bundle protein [Melioribacteraceae bacterium]